MFLGFFRAKGLMSCVFKVEIVLEKVSATPFDKNIYWLSCSIFMILNLQFLFFISLSIKPIIIIMNNPHELL